MGKMEGEKATRDSGLEAHARRVGDHSAGLMARVGLSRLAGGILLVVLGILVLVVPDLIVWFVGIGAIVLGILVLAGAPASKL